MNTAPVSRESASRTPGPGVSVVIPVKNGASWIERVLDAIYAQRENPLEVIAVDDGSTDGSREILVRHAAHGRLVLLEGERRGAAAAINKGVRAGAHPFVAQIDQDVVIEANWVRRLVDRLRDPSVAAAQGQYVCAPDADVWSRVMALDLRQRYRALGQWANHVCTGNTVYRKAALLEVGLFDETLGYGYDNDMSYRLAEAGWRLAFCREATSVHNWREGMAAYSRQQYGFGYGRLDVIAKHPGRIAGDDVSGPGMMAHAPLTGGALLLGAAALGLSASGLPAAWPATASAAILAALAAERTSAGVRAAVSFDDPAGYWYAPVHLVRNVAWAAAIAVWSVRRLGGATPAPSDSMPSRPVVRD
ncbi:MAG: glycosyltransferase family 2 protein [Vicinamibacterales bacterium]